MDCYDCEYFDRWHYEIYGEEICAEAGEIIEIRPGQGKPEWCPKEED